MQMFVAAEKVGAFRALEMGLIEAVADDPIAAALVQISERRT
jgi:enoyl-CoA hydratase/carnithine racemase